MDTGAVADTLMSALTRVQTALAPPPDTAGDAEYAAQVEDDLHWLECDQYDEQMLVQTIRNSMEGWNTCHALYVCKQKHRNYI